MCELEKSRHLAVASSEMGQWNKNIFLDWYKELKIKKKGNVFELASQTKAVLLLAGVQRGIESSGRSCAGSTWLAGQGNLTQPPREQPSTQGHESSVGL